MSDPLREAAQAVDEAWMSVEVDGVVQMRYASYLPRVLNELRQALAASAPALPITTHANPTFDIVTGDGFKVVPVAAPSPALDGCCVCGKAAKGLFPMCGDHGRYGGVDLEPAAPAPALDGWHDCGDPYCPHSTGTRIAAQPDPLSRHGMIGRGMDMKIQPVPLAAPAPDAERIAARVMDEFARATPDGMLPVEIGHWWAARLAREIAAILAAPAPDADLAYEAWVVIANAMDMLPDQAPMGSRASAWRGAALRWRDRYHAAIGGGVSHAAPDHGLGDAESRSVDVPAPEQSTPGG